jgi:hypothetical protein
LQFGNQRLQAFGPEADLHAIWREIDRSTVSRTMRTCSAGNSSSHSGGAMFRSAATENCVDGL